MNNNILSTLFVGIDVSSKTNAVCAIDFHSNKFFEISTRNNFPGAEIIADAIIEVLNNNNFTHIIIALESTSIYSVHISNFLSTYEPLMFFKPMVYCLNPKTTANYRKSFEDLDKTDPNDAFLIADFARVGRIRSKPWRGSQFLALQRLTRHRLHLIKTITREKSYMLSNIYLKFSELAIIDKNKRPFSNTFGATSAAILTDFLSLDDIAYAEIEELITFITKKSKNNFSNPEATANLLKKAAKDSYRLDKTLYEPLNVSIASSFSIIQTITKEVKLIDKAIIKTIKGLNTNEYQSLISIPGIGPVFAAGIISEIGTIKIFKSNDSLAKYAGLTWRQNQSGNFKADITKMTKTGNKYLRYYLIEAANSVRNYSQEYNDFYNKKANEVSTHSHKRALALTSRKLVRLIFGLLNKDQLYSNDRVGNQLIK